MAKKKNPRTIPRTQADCDKAWNEGVIVGVSNAIAIFMTVIVDKFNGAEYVKDLWNEINKLSEEVSERRVSVPDLKRVLKEEYEIDV